MKKEEFAELINVSRNTLTNWEKDKPELVRLINQGLLMDEIIKETEEQLNKLKEMKKMANSGKLKLK